MRYFVNHPDRVDIVRHSSNSATFQISKRPGIQRENGMPSFWAVAAAVFINYETDGRSAINTWNDAGLAINRLFEPARKITPEIKAEVEKISVGKVDRFAKLQAISDFVSQEIRYVAIEIGVGGFQPHLAGDVYRHKYGDCKDKATLMVTMLEDIGVRAYPVLLGTRGSLGVEPDFPTLTRFNHAIVALPVPLELRNTADQFTAYDSKNNILWIDPTSENHPLGSLPESDQGVYALVLYPDRGQLYRTPEITVENNGMEYEALLRLDPAGNGTADVSVKYQGEFNTDRHAYYRGESRSELRRMLESRVARYVSGATLVQAGISGLEDYRNTITVNLSFTGSFAGAHSGRNWFFQPLFLSGMSAVEVGRKPRVYSLDLGSAYHVNGKYQIELPTGARLDDVPEAVSLQSEFGTLKVEYSLNGKTLTATHALSFLLSRIPPEKYPDFRKFVNQVKRVQRQRLRLTF